MNTNSDNILNDILESAFHTVINDPAVISDFNNRFNISTNEQNQNDNRNNEHYENNEINEDYEEDTTNNNTDTSNSSYLLNNLQVIRDYTNFLSNYSENMRLYSFNIGQMNRCLSNTINNVGMSNIPQQRSARNFRNSNTTGNTLSSMFPATHIRFITPNNDNTNNNTNRIPTMDQILRQTRIFVFSNETRTAMSSEQCAITLNDFSEGDIVAELNHCKHVFKMNSLFTWFSRNSQCPVCRHNISR